eukprot:TRINITY_DN25678_c0_g1_i1.p1 TRINITY_DN25678_c0_g1~~TRINITY_DN25678_c0_g1_i1.p1  ORF type:complete len:178 (+),score=12.77 TRINITY_DN25678_c0_g1_i1:290-823(+)
MEGLLDIRVIVAECAPCLFERGALDFRLAAPKAWEGQRDTREPTVSMTKRDLTRMIEEGVIKMSSLCLEVKYLGKGIGEVRVFGTVGREGRIDCEATLNGCVSEFAFPGEENGILWVCARKVMASAATTVARALDEGGEEGGVCRFHFGELFGDDSDYVTPIERDGLSLTVKPRLRG